MLHFHAFLTGWCADHNPPPAPESAAGRTGPEEVQRFRCTETLQTAQSNPVTSSEPGVLSFLNVPQYSCGPALERQTETRTCQSACPCCLWPFKQPVTTELSSQQQGQQLSNSLSWLSFTFCLYDRLHNCQTVESVVLEVWGLQIMYFTLKWHYSWKMTLNRHKQILRL